MIRSFADRDTERLWKQERVSRFTAVETPGRRRLRLLNAATSLKDLGQVPGNRLEWMKGARKGQYSLRINDQWRICFRWYQGDAYEVEIVDYH